MPSPIDIPKMTGENVVRPRLGSRKDPAGKCDPDAVHRVPFVTSETAG